MAGQAGGWQPAFTTQETGQDPTAGDRRLGLEKASAAQYRDFLELLDDRHGIAATLIASQFPPARWHELVGDATVADAILDRLIHGAHRIELKGESMRKLCDKGASHD